MSNKLSEAHDALLRYGLGFPSAHEDRPWGERVVKVRKKIFVFFGRFDEDQERLSLTVKLPESAAQALDTGFAEPSGYGMGKHGWVTATFGPGDLPSIDVLRAWIDESYRAIAPKRRVADLDKRESVGARPANSPAKPAVATKKVAKATKRNSATKSKAAAKPKPRAKAAPRKRAATKGPPRAKKKLARSSK